MGGGSAAATNVDSIPSPRRAAIEEAQAELRQEVTAREALRKELDFLEKGGNPLDFKFGLPLLLPLTGELLSSELDGLCVRNTFDANVNCVENGRYIEQSDEGKHFGPRENGSACPRHVSDGPVGSDAEDKKVQVSTKKLKQKKDQFGNGHASPRTIPCDADHSSMCRFQVPPTCSADVREIGTCLPQTNDHAPADQEDDKRVIQQEAQSKEREKKSTYIITEEPVVNAVFEDGKVPEENLKKANDSTLQNSAEIPTISAADGHPEMENKVKEKTEPAGSKDLTTVKNEEDVAHDLSQPAALSEVPCPSGEAINDDLNQSTKVLSSGTQPLGKGIESSACADSEKHKSATSAVAKKAQEDVLLEEAETIKAARKQAAEWARRKPGAEPARRKSHWDFMLEEMAWLANDFMQERLWKTAAAAQVCRWAAQKTRETKVAAAEIKRNKKRVAHVLANIVMKYWQTASRLKQQPESCSDLPDDTKKRKENEDEAVPMEVDPPSAQAPAPKLRPLQQYVLRNSIDMNLASMSPGIHPISDSSIYLMEQFDEESLFFVVSEGSLETYRLSIEKNWDSYVSEKLLQDSLTEQRLSTGINSVEDSFADDSRSFGGRSSPKLPEDDFGMHYMPGELTISKKKRKRILKGQTPKTFEVPGSAGTYADANRVSSPAKRPTPGGASSIGVIPTKRMRTSAVAARQRAAATTLSPGGQRGAASSASTNSQQEDLLSFPESRASESDSVGPSRRGGLAPSSLRSKKKKKKAFHSDFSTDAISNSHIAAKTEAESSQQEPLRSLEQEQLKRKNDQYSPMSSELDTPGTPGSQGLFGIPPLKKMKSSKHSPDLTEAGPSATQTSAGTPNLTSSSKLLRQNSTRDRIRRNKAAKGHFIQSSINPSGIGIPWSAIEDQAILALVHDLGPNWELVSDVLSSSSQLKGIFRKPKDCKERHRVLLDRLSNESGENMEDPGTSQSHPSTLPGIPKGSARVLLQRLQGPMEEDTVKVHLERIVNIVQNHRSKQQQNDSLESQELLPVHQSHLNTVSQYSTNNMGVPVSPLDLCEHPMSNGDLPGHGYSLPQHPGLGVPGVLAGNGIRPNSAGLPLLPHLGPIVSPGSAAINAAAARDAQRMAASMRPLSAEEQRLRYTRMVTGRSLQPQGNSPGSLSSLASLPNSSDCTVPMSTAGLMGLNRGGLSLPRPGMPGMMSPGVSGIASTGLLPQGGVGMPASGSMMAGGIPSPANFMRRTSQMIRSGRCTEEQKQHFIQELQHHAAQGNPQAVAALKNLNMNLSNAMASSPTQSFAPQQQQQHLSPQQQSYLAAVRLVNERQQQQQQQQNQQNQQQPQRMFQQPGIQSQMQMQQHQQLGLLTPPSQQSAQGGAQQHSPLSPSSSQPQQSSVLQGTQAGQTGQPAQPSTQPQVSAQMGQLSGHQKVQVPPSQKQSLTKQPSFQQQQLLQVQQQSKMAKNASGRVLTQTSHQQQAGSSAQLPSPSATSQIGQAQRTFSSSQGGMQQGAKQQPSQAGNKLQSQSQGGQLQQGSMAQQQKSLQQPLKQSSPVPAAPSTPPPQPQASVASTSAPAAPALTSTSQQAPSTSQNQNQRRQTQQNQQQQQQNQQRKPQQKQANTNPNLQTTGKNNSTQPNMLQSQQSPYQLGTNMANPMSIGSSSPSLPPNAAGHSTSWKGQNFPSISAGMYNLARSSSAPPSQAGVTASNGNAGTTGSPFGGMSMQNQAGKLGSMPGVNGRPLSQGSAAQRPALQQGGASSSSHIGTLPVPVPTNTMNTAATRAARPPSSSASTAGAAFQGTSVPNLGQPAPMHMYGVQPRQVPAAQQQQSQQQRPANGTGGSSQSTAAPPTVVTSSSSPR